MVWCVPGRRWDGGDGVGGSWVWLERSSGWETEAWEPMFDEDWEHDSRQW